MSDRVDTIFDNLDKWRHLPSYRLEGRADVFLSAYLPDIIEARLGSRPVVIVPEFPIHHPTIYPDITDNRSSKVDYLCVLPGLRCVLVEFKTDPASRRSKQDAELERARGVGMGALLDGLRHLYRATKAKKKYRCLLKALDQARLIRLAEKGSFEVLANGASLEILYIQPLAKGDDAGVMSFAQVADIIERHSDSLSLRFAASLREWADIKAGSAQ